MVPFHQKIPRLLLLALLCSVLLCVPSNAFQVPTVSSLHHQSFAASPKQRHCRTSLPRPSRTSTTTSLGAATSFAFGSSIPVIRRQVVNAISTVNALLLKEFNELSRIQRGLLVGTFVVGFVLGRWKPFWKRYTSVMDIPSNMFGKVVLRGRAITVSDGDTLRFLHTPTWFSPTSLRDGERASEIGLPVRVCTIDTPETPKFGKPGQKYGTEAKEKLKSLVDDNNNNKRVNVRLLQKDQYGRVVGDVYTGRWFFKRHVDTEMLQAGLAEVYQGGGAVYGKLGKERYLEIEQTAKDQKIGIWSQKNRESAAEYKARTK